MEEKRSFIVTSFTLISWMLIEVKSQGPGDPLASVPMSSYVTSVLPSGTTTVLSTVSMVTPPPTSRVPTTEPSTKPETTTIEPTTAEMTAFASKRRTSQPENTNLSHVLEVRDKLQPDGK